MALRPHARGSRRCCRGRGRRAPLLRRARPLGQRRPCLPCDASARFGEDRAMTLADPAQLVDVDALIGAYYDHRPDPEAPEQRVAFGTSGHRGTSRANTFTESPVLAVAEAVCRQRAQPGIDGPLLLGRDTHALSEPAARTVVEVLTAHGVDVVVDDRDGYTPTPVISHAILTHNRAGEPGTADGIVVTPSHNPPEDG